jgi:ABC-type transporter Mla maintaining outer membrane lipid asymmetry permease subunit MlaE
MLLFASPVLIYMILSGLLTGFISTWFLFEHFPYREFLAPLVHDNTLESLGFVQFRILVPLLTALLLAARNSAMISADFGHRVYASQIDAMKNLSIPYWLYLIVNVVITMILACLFYNAFNFLLCALSTLYTWKFIHPTESVYIWKTVYYREIMNGIFPEGIEWVVGKMSLSGLVIGTISSIFGLRQKNSVIDMNHSIAWSIIWATSLVLIIHAVFALMEI